MGISNNENTEVRKIKFLRVLSLMVLTMFLFNLFMAIFHGEGWSGEIVTLLPALLFFTLIGLIVPPAFVALLFFAFIMDTLYVKETIEEYWVFCVSAGLIGMSIFIMILVGFAVKNFSLYQIFLMFIIHTLSTAWVYRKKYKRVMK